MNTNRRRALSSRLGLAIAALSALVVATFGGVEMAASWHQTRARLHAEQLDEAHRIVSVLTLAVAMIDRQVQAVEKLPWAASSWLSLDTRRDEYGRLLKLMPAIESIRHVNGQRADVLRVARLEVDRLHPPRQPDIDEPTPTTRVWFRNGNDPILDLVFAHPANADPVPGFTVVTLGLRALARELAATLERSDAEVYVVDPEGAIVLHRNPSVLLSRRVVAIPQGSGTWSARSTLRQPEQSVLMSATPVPGLPWRVVIEQPRDMLLAPAWKTLQRTAWFVVGAVAASMALSLWLAGRFTRPIRHLHTGAQHLAAGDLATRIDIRTGDELEDLAAQFNRMAASLQASVAELEARVAERTAELALANQHKSEFLAHMSHELRTPLNAILGFADVLREGMAGPLTDEQREYLGDIHASGLHLLALINDVLDIARIEAGRLELELAPLVVAELVGATVASMRAAALKKNLVLTVDIGTAPSSLVGDARRLKQVLLNLIGNAVKFTPEGGRIAVRARPSTRFAGGLRVEVQDSGVGIAPAELDQVWSAFVRVGGRDTAQVEGAGLGLPLVKKLVELHGGSVGVASAPGAGSDFHIELPATPPAATPGEAP